MRAPAFWWRKPGVLANLLRPIGAAYGAIAAARLRQSGANAGVPVICFGDFTLGGAGKTPAALATAALLADAHERPVFLTRGYGGRLAGPVQVEPVLHCAADVGDEPLLLARVAPTVVARNRLAGAALVHELGASAIVMDDGFHNPALAKTVAVLVVDAARGVGNCRIFPAGPLRAPLAAQLARAHAILAVGEGDGAAPVIDEAQRFGLPVFAARLEPDATAASALCERDVLAFAGIGRPEKFFRTLERAGVTVASRHAFGDHHRFTAAEATRLLAEADRRDLTLVTTEKDFVRLSGDHGSLRRLRQVTRTLPVRLAFENAEKFSTFMLTRISAQA